MENTAVGKSKHENDCKNAKEENRNKSNCGKILESRLNMYSEKCTKFFLNKIRRIVFSEDSFSMQELWRILEEVDH